LRQDAENLPVEEIENLDDQQKSEYEGDFVAALGEITLKNEQQMEVQHAYCDVWRFREGKMAALQAFVIESAP
jgi:hypothetical protein